jgi:TolB-like protein
VRKHWARFAAIALIVLGGVGAVGHFLGGLAGWWEFFHLTGRLAGGSGARTEASQSSTRSAATLSIVVLPFANEGAAEDAWFADSLSADIALELSRASGSSVIGRDTAASYRGRQVDPREVARELNVRYVLLGSARRSADKVRIEARLVDGDSGIQKWGERFDLDRNELARAVDDIALRLARSVGVELYRSAGAAAVLLPPSAVRADDLAMRGLSVYFRGASPENFREALALFEQAVAEDPRSVRGWGGVTFINYLQYAYGWTDDREKARRRVEEAAARVNQLDSGDFFAILALATMALMNRDWNGLLAVADRIVERFPGHPTGYSNRAAALLFLGRFEDMLAPNQRALDLSPRDTQAPLRMWQRAFALFALGRNAEAADWARKSAAANARLPLPAPTLAAALARDGKRDEAARILAEHMKQQPGFSAERIAAILRSDQPEFVAARGQLVDALREIGLK